MSMDGRYRRRLILLIPASAVVLGCDADHKPAATATQVNNSGVRQALKKCAHAIDTLVRDDCDCDDSTAGQGVWCSVGCESCLPPMTFRKCRQKEEWQAGERLTTKRLVLLSPSWFELA